MTYTMRKALEPFAIACNANTARVDSDDLILKVPLTVGDLRRARSAYADGEGERHTQAIEAVSKHYNMSHDSIKLVVNAYLSALASPSPMGEIRDYKPPWALRGGPEQDYPCRNPAMTCCALSECQSAKRCRHVGEKNND